MLSTPVLQQEWEAFIAEMGGTVSPKATAVIEVRLLPSLPEIPMNRDEAYRLNVTKKRRLLGYADFTTTGREKKLKNTDSRS